MQSFFRSILRVLYNSSSSHALLKETGQIIGLQPITYWSKEDLRKVIKIHIKITYESLEIDTEHHLFKHLLHLYFQRLYKELTIVAKRNNNININSNRSGFYSIDIEKVKEESKNHTIRQIVHIKAILTQNINERNMNTEDDTNLKHTYFPLPKHISDVIFDSKKIVECTICYEILTKEKYSLSKCGHDYCSPCFLKLSRNALCAVCRQNL